MSAWAVLLDEARAVGLAEGRARERWLRQQAAESATFVGTLLDLAESGVAVSVAVHGGRRHDGRVAAVGDDLVALADRDATVLVRLGAIALVRPHPGVGATVASGDRPAALHLGLSAVLGRVAADHPEVAIGLTSGDAIAGELLAAGVDIVTVRLAPGPDGIAYCSTTSLSSVRFRSG